MSMNQKLIVRCVLGSLLATSAGCMGDGWGLEQSDEDEASAQDELAAPRPSQSVDAGIPEDEEVHDAGKGAERRDGGFVWPGNDAQVDPPEGDPSCGPFPGPPPDSVLGKDAGKQPESKDAGFPPGMYPDAGAPVAPPEACFGLTVGSTYACLSYDDAKLKLSESCAARGYELVELSQKHDGTCKPGAASSSWGTCCPRQLASVGLCTIDVLGDGKTCLDPDTLKQRASAACEARKATLTNLVIDNDVCAGGSALAEYECCE